MICALCLKKVTPETSVYSVWRKVRYCAPPWTACDKRRAKLAKEAEKAAA